MTMLAERPPDAPPPSTLTELERKAAAAKDGDLEAYAAAVHRQDVELYQLAWYEALETEDKLVIICPPDTFKSTTVQYWAEQALGRDHDLRILWLMGTQAQAEKRVIAIKETIEENAVYQAAFHVEPNKAAKWTNTELFIRRSFTSPDPSLMATGFLGAYQGLHFDRIVIDDPTDQDDVKSPTVMEAQRNRLRGVLTDRLVEGGRMVVIMTRWAEADLLPIFREMGFRIVQMPVQGPNYPWGPTISPKRFPPERIPQLIKQKGEALFNLTYMCDTSALSGQLIKREHLHYWDSKMIPEGAMPVFMALDPAVTEKTSADRSAITTLGYDFRARRMLVLDIWQGRVEVPELRDILIRLAYQTAGLVAIGIETVAFQASLMQDLRRMAALPFVEIPYRTRRQVQAAELGIDKNKTSRALYLTQLFSSGRLFLPRGLPAVDGVSFETELLNFGSSTNPYHDDAPDSLAFAAALADAAVPMQTQVNLVGGL